MEEESQHHECPICLERIQDGNIYETTCNHIFCRQCINKMLIKTLTYTCPMCSNRCSELKDALNNCSTEDLFEIYVKVIKSEESRRLEVSRDLYNMIGFVLLTKNKGKALLDYLLNNSDDEEFKYMYTSTVLEGKTYFAKIEDPVENFAMALLYHKYH